MTIPNATHGGPVHSDRTTAVDCNDSGTSRAKFAQQPYDPEWIATHDVDDRQCAAIGTQLCQTCGISNHQSDAACKSCGSLNLTPTLCTNVAVDGKATCGAHGGNFKLTPKHRAALLRGTLKFGLNFQEIMLCPCAPYANTCMRKCEIQDADGVDRCAIEQDMIDSISSAFIEEYELDDVADMLMLSRLTMTMVRIARAEKNIVKYGELVERTRSQPNGSVEIWMEQNPSGNIVNQLDSRLQAWLKALALSRDARSNLELTNARVDIAQLLSDPQSDVKTIDITTDEDDYES